MEKLINVKKSRAQSIDVNASVTKTKPTQIKTVERAREWYALPDDAEALKLREKTLDRRLMFIEGVAPPAH
ncbi:MAG: hypothetical protein ACREPR_14065 [Brasilonema sp.]